MWNEPFSRVLIAGTLFTVVVDVGLGLTSQPVESKITKGTVSAANPNCLAIVFPLPACQPAGSFDAVLGDTVIMQHALPKLNDGNHTFFCGTKRGEKPSTRLPELEAPYQC